MKTLIISLLFITSSFAQWGGEFAFSGTSSSGWDVSTASYTSKSFLVTSQETSPRGEFFSADGSKMYIVGFTYYTVFEYSLSTPYDISTASYSSKSYLIPQDAYPFHLYFKPDGTKMYVVGTNNNIIYQYTLSTAWDVSTASYDSKSFNPSSQVASPKTVSFSSDGTKTYISGGTTIYQYTLSTAWDVSTATYASKSFSDGSQDSAPEDVFFKQDGTKLYMLGYTNKYVYEYSLSTAWDVSTASYISKSFSVGSQDSLPWSLFISSNGNYMYMLGGTNKYVYEYSLP